MSPDSTMSHVSFDTSSEPAWTDEDTSGGGPRCDTRWPLLLVHGVGFRDDRNPYYWGRIPRRLVECGARVYRGNQDAWGSFEDNARMLRKSLLDAVEQSGCTKVNIIAHSKGGLDARVLASMEDCAAHIASITTVATPHAGSRTLDWVMRAPTFLLKVAAVPVNGFYRWLGDSEPDFFTVCSQLTTNSMRRFNDEHPASSAIFCQSYATVMSSPLNDLSMAVPYLVVRHFEGQNDGLVAASAASYGSFGGIIVDGISRGVSHRDVVDRKQGTLERRVQQKNTGTQQASFDVVEWYLRLVADLRARGF